MLHGTRTASLAASALCVASHLTDPHLTDPRMSPCVRTNSFASWIRHLQTEYAMCVASVSMSAITAPQEGKSWSGFRIVRRFAHQSFMCIPKWKEHGLHAARMLGGERRRPRPGCSGERGRTNQPLPGRTPALRASTTVEVRTAHGADFLSFCSSKCTVM